MSTPGSVGAKNSTVPPGATEFKACLAADGAPTHKITKSASLPSLYFLT